MFTFLNAYDQNVTKQTKNINVANSKFHKLKEKTRQKLMHLKRKNGLKILNIVNQLTHKIP